MGILHGTMGILHGTMGIREPISASSYPHSCVEGQESLSSKEKFMFFIERYFEDMPAVNGFFYHGNTRSPKNHCDSIVNWEHRIDIAGFTEDIHADMFTGDPRWKSERHRTTCLAVLRDLALCLYDMFPDCKSPLFINRDLLRAMRNVDMDFATLPSPDKMGWFLQKREYSNHQGEQKAKWVRMTEKEVLEAIEAGDILLGEGVRNVARTVFGKKGADWILFETDQEKVLKEDSKMVPGFRFELYIPKESARLMSITWTNEVSRAAGPCDLNVLCNTFNVSLSKLPPPDTDLEGKPIDILRANWKNKVRLDWRTYYPLYLKSAEWYLVRQVFFMVSNGHCANVGCDTKATQIHHLSHNTVACERIQDLIPLCRRCHADFHQRVKVLGKSDVEEIQRRHENRAGSLDPLQPLQVRLRLN